MKNSAAETLSILTRWTATTAFLATLNIFSSVVPVQARPVIETPNTSISAPSQPEILAQVAPCSVRMNGVFKLQFSGGLVLHRATFYMEGCTGKLVTTFFNGNTGKTETVEQRMIQGSSDMGLFWFGYNPVYAGTNNPHPSYNADNLFFQLDTDGQWKIYNYDRAGVFSPVRILDYRE